MTAAEVDRPASRAVYAVGHPGRSGTEVRATRLTTPVDVPDTVVDSVELPFATVRAASVRGLSHRRHGQPRQDAYSLGVTTEPLVITVCDGVGSLTRSHEAAHHVCRRVPELVGDEDTVAWPTVFTTLSEELAALDRPAGRDAPRSLATTVLVARLRAMSEDVTAVSLAWVGDSHAFVLRAGGWEPITRGPSEQEQTDVVSSSTQALPSSHPVPDTTEVTLLAGDLLVLTTDGIADPMGRGTGVVGEALATWWRSAPDPLEFAAQLGFHRRGFFDDRTAVAVWMTPSESPS